MEILVGSMLGASEEVAEQIAEYFSSLNINSNIHLQPDIKQLNKKDTWLICTSTHGAGELPDNIQPFANQLKNQRDLSEVNYLIIGLGDSSYDDFCHGAVFIDQLLQRQNAHKLIDTYKIDVSEYSLPEEPALEWIQQQTEKLTPWLK